MIIARQEALDLVNSGEARFDGYTLPEEFGPRHNGTWIIKRYDKPRVDHVVLDADEPLTGCLDCGGIVAAEEDAIGCGCHCPECHATL